LILVAWNRTGFITPLAEQRSDLGRHFPDNWRRFCWLPGFYGLVFGLGPFFRGMKNDSWLISLLKDLQSALDYGHLLTLVVRLSQSLGEGELNCQGAWDPNTFRPKRHHRHKDRREPRGFQ